VLNHSCWVGFLTCCRPKKHDNAYTRAETWARSKAALSFLENHPVGDQSGVISDGNNAQLLQDFRGKLASTIFIPPD
jgi:hypothetical protein